MLERTRLLAESVGGGPIGLAVPLVRQTTSYSCGAAALLAVLRYWRPDAVTVSTDRLLLKPLGTTAKSGTDAGKLVAVARAYGLRAELLRGVGLEDARRRIKRGQTLIVDFQAWPKSGRAGARRNDGHFAVLLGMDAARVYLMDPWIIDRYGHVPINELLKAWIDNGHNRQLAVAIWGDRAPTRKRLGITRLVETGAHIK